MPVNYLCRGDLRRLLRNDIPGSRNGSLTDEVVAVNLRPFDCDEDIALPDIP